LVCGLVHQNIKNSGKKVHNNGQRRVMRQTHGVHDHQSLTRTTIQPHHLTAAQRWDLNTSRKAAPWPGSTARSGPTAKAVTAPGARPVATIVVMLSACVLCRVSWGTTPPPKDLVGGTWALRSGCCMRVWKPVRIRPTLSAVAFAASKNGPGGRVGRGGGGGEAHPSPGLLGRSSPPPRM